MKKYSEDAKVELLKRIDELCAQGASFSSACRAVNVSPQTAKNWKKQFDADNSATGDPPETSASVVNSTLTVSEEKKEGPDEKKSEVDELDKIDERIFLLLFIVNFAGFFSIIASGITVREYLFALFCFSISGLFFAASTLNIFFRATLKVEDKHKISNWGCFSTIAVMLTFGGLTSLIAAVTPIGAFVFASFVVWVFIDGHAKYVKYARQTKKSRKKN